MIIHVVRHAEAIERTPEVAEEHRFLTERGRRRFRKVCKSLGKVGVDPDLILTSPMIRAVQTADILAERMRYNGELLISTLLAPGFRPDALDQLLNSYPDAREVAIVGHEPDLGALAQALLPSDESCALPKGGVVSFRKSTGDQGAEFLQLVTGGARIITSRSKALERLQGQERSK